MANPLLYIRTIKFGLTQAEFSSAIGVRQSTVSSWERGGHPRYIDMIAIRDLAKSRGIAWSDRLFFELPED